MDYQAILDTIHRDIQPYLGQGRVADYIPELAGASATDFGMAIVTLGGDVSHGGQSGCAVLDPERLQAVCLHAGLPARRRNALPAARRPRAPSGSAFNSLVQLEYENGIPRNPFINAGALVVTDVPCRRFVQAETALVQFMRRLVDNPRIDYVRRVAESELAHADRNRAMAHFMKSFGNLHMPVETVIDAYCRQCAIEMDCTDLARAVLFLANGGVVPWSGEQHRRCEPCQAPLCTDADLRHLRRGGRLRLSRGAARQERRGRRHRRRAAGRIWRVRVVSGARRQRQFASAGLRALEWLTTLTGRSIF
ncbi:glutaminase [Cupriavidus basilensis]